MSFAPLPITQSTIIENSFTEKNVNKTAFTLSEAGSFLLSPGDYSIPVMTYCMKSSSSSPKGQIYTLDQMKGNLSIILKKLILKAPSYFSTTDIQITIWSLLSEISYQEMTEESRKIIDQIIPEHRNELEKSVINFSKNKLNDLSDLTNGKIPRLSDIPNFEEMINFRDKLKEFGHDYEELRRQIDTSYPAQKKYITPWSKISENIFVRFITKGSFGDIGFLQVRVFQESGRIINLESQKKYSLDVASLIANPNDPNVQPLSFSPLFGIAGIVSTPRIVTNPRAAALLVALTLAAYPMNWGDFFKLDELLKDVHLKNIQHVIERGNKILRKEHDELEKPLKDAGIISGKTKNTSSKKNGEVRQYTKIGGIEQLEKDFKNAPGVEIEVNGLKIKSLPDGTKIIKRPKGSDSGPTLEIQPPKDNSRYPDSKIRVKVRYL